jgi:hypothetical protein
MGISKPKWCKCSVSHIPLLTQHPFCGTDALTEQEETTSCTSYLLLHRFLCVCGCWYARSSSVWRR